MTVRAPDTDHDRTSAIPADHDRMPPHTVSSWSTKMCAWPTQPSIRTAQVHLSACPSDRMTRLSALDGSAAPPCMRVQATWVQADERGPVANALLADWTVRSDVVVEELLHLGLHVAMYNGVRDLSSCNHIGNLQARRMRMRLPRCSHRPLGLVLLPFHSSSLLAAPLAPIAANAPSLHPNLTRPEPLSSAPLVLHRRMLCQVLLRLCSSAGSPCPDFSVAPNLPWPSTQQVNGHIRTSGNLSYATVLRTGHLVPTVVPAAFKELLEMLLATARHKRVRQ